MLLNKCIRPFFLEDGQYWCYLPKRTNLDGLNSRQSVDVNSRRALSYDLLSKPTSYGRRSMTLLTMYKSNRPLDSVFIIISRTKEQMGEYSVRYGPEYLIQVANPGDCAALVPVILSRRLNSLFSDRFAETDRFKRTAS